MVIAKKVLDAKPDDDGTESEWGDLSLTGTAGGDPGSARTAEVVMGNLYVMDSRLLSSEVYNSAHVCTNWTVIYICEL